MHRICKEEKKGKFNLSSAATLVSIRAITFGISDHLYHVIISTRKEACRHRRMRVCVCVCVYREQAKESGGRKLIKNIEQHMTINEQYACKH